MLVGNHFNLNRPKFEKCCNVVTLYNHGLKHTELASLLLITFFFCFGMKIMRGTFILILVQYGVVICKIFKTM